MENEEEPSVLTLLTDFDTENHGLDVMRLALNYHVKFINIFFIVGISIHLRNIYFSTQVINLIYLCIL